MGSRLEEQASARRGGSVCRVRVRSRERNAVLNVATPGALQQLVEKTAGLTRISRHFRDAFLGRVEFLEDHHGQKHVMFLKTEDGGRIVDEHVGIQDEDPPFTEFFSRLLLWRCGPAERLLGLHGFCPSHDWVLSLSVPCGMLLKLHEGCSSARLKRG